MGTNDVPVFVHTVLTGLTEPKGMYVESRNKQRLEKRVRDVDEGHLD